MTATLPYHDAPLTAEQKLDLVFDLNNLIVYAIDVRDHIRGKRESEDFTRLRNDFAQVIDRLALAFPLPYGEDID